MRNTQRAERLGQFHAAVARERAVFEKAQDHLLHEERIAFGLLEDQAFERGEARVTSEQRSQHLFRAILAQWVETKLRVVGLAAPLMAVFGSVVEGLFNNYQVRRLSSTPKAPA